MSSRSTGVEFFMQIKVKPVKAQSLQANLPSRICLFQPITRSSENSKFQIPNEMYNKIMRSCFWVIFTVRCPWIRINLVDGLKKDFRQFFQNQCWGRNRSTLISCQRCQTVTKLACSDCIKSRLLHQIDISMFVFITYHSLNRYYYQGDFAAWVIERPDLESCSTPTLSSGCTRIC